MTTDVNNGDGFKPLEPFFFSTNGRPGMNLKDALRMEFTGGTALCCKTPQEPFRVGYWWVYYDMFFPRRSELTPPTFSGYS